MKGFKVSQEDLCGSPVAGETVREREALKALISTKKLAIPFQQSKRFSIIYGSSLDLGIKVDMHNMCIYIYTFILFSFEVHIYKKIKNTHCWTMTGSYLEPDESNQITLKFFGYNLMFTHLFHKKVPHLQKSGASLVVLQLVGVPSDSRTWQREIAIGIKIAPPRGP